MQILRWTFDLVFFQQNHFFGALSLENRTILDSLLILLVIRDTIFHLFISR